jgi:hypothetical protein
MVSVFRSFGEAQSVERDRVRRGKGIVRFSEPICASDGHSTHLRVHSRGECIEVGELGASS